MQLVPVQLVVKYLSIHLPVSIEVTMDRVCHFEIPYADKARADKFYQDVFGWQIVPAPTEMPYSFVMTTPVDEQFRPTQPGGINGGMYQRSDEGGSKSPRRGDRSRIV